MVMSPENNEGAGNAGCALHPRSRVQNCAKKRTRAYRFSGGTPAFPAQWLYGLCRALPGDEFVLSPSLADQGWSSSVELTSPPRNLAPATGVGTTRFCRTLWRRSSCAPVDRSRETRPATPFRADAAASTASPPAFVTIAIRPSVGRDSESYGLICISEKQKYFCKRGWTSKNRRDP